MCRARGQLSTVIRWLYLHFWKTVTRWWWFLGNSIFLCGFHLARKPSHLTSLPHFQNWYNELTWTKIVDCILLGLWVEPHKEIRKEDCMWGCSTLYVCEVTVRQGCKLNGNYCFSKNATKLCDTMHSWFYLFKKKISSNSKASIRRSWNSCSDLLVVCYFRLLEYIIWHVTCVNTTVFNFCYHLCCQVMCEECL